MASTHDHRTPEDGAGPHPVLRGDAEVGAITDVGRVRSENQDHYGISEGTSDELYFGKGRLVVVCDGMGGHNGGTIASRTTVAEVVRAFEQSGPHPPRELLDHAIRRANQAVREKQAQDPALRHMGTTLVAALSFGRHVFIAHVGDSRAYIFRQGEAEQISKDHTYLNELIDIGLLTPEKAKNHPERNIITRCVGMGDDLKIDWNYREARIGDQFLLCSDGLYNHVEDEEMLQAVTSLDPQRACQELCDLANRRGGEDNITVAILKVKELLPEFEASAQRLGVSGAAASGTVTEASPLASPVSAESETPPAGNPRQVPPTPTAGDAPRVPPASASPYTAVMPPPTASGSVSRLRVFLRLFIALEVLVLMILLVLLLRMS